jgi:hypothetical protein
MNPFDFANQVGKYIKDFISDLIMGDFNEHQGAAAQLVSGAISFIPVLGQIIAVRDVAGSLFVIQRHGGLGKATIGQKVDLGFTAFGLIPEAGAVFKMAKPLYKEAKLASKVTTPIVHLIEGMRGVGKGGAVRWLKALNWAGNTQLAISYANNALMTCVDGFDSIATNTPTWAPYSSDIRHLAREAEGGLKGFQGQLDTPIRQASGEIRKFIGQILGEHAAQVAAAVTRNIAGSSTGSRRHSGSRAGTSHGSSSHPGSHGTTPAHPKAKAKPIPATPAAKKTHVKVGGQERVVAGTSNSKRAKAVIRIAYDTYKTMKPFEQGFFGEHIADYYVIEHKGWGLHWNRHDMDGGAKGKPKGWQGEPRKLNDAQQPLYLCRPPSVVTARGIDAAWLTNRTAPHEFAITEAKASMSKHSTLYNMLGEADGGASAKPSKPAKGGAGFKNKNKNKPIPSTPKKSAKPKKMVMQMSHAWIQQKIKIDNAYAAWRNRMITITGKPNYSRHVFLITPEEMIDHLKIQAKIVLEGLIDQPAAAQKYAPKHADHKISKEFGEADLNVAEKTYKAQGKAKKPKGK